jgi:hypothetical protein
MSTVLLLIWAYFNKQDILFHVNDNYITTYRHKKYLEKLNLDQSKQSQSF